MSLRKPSGTVRRIKINGWSFLLLVEMGHCGSSPAPRFKRASTSGSKADGLLYPRLAVAAAAQTCARRTHRVSGHSLLLPTHRGQALAVQLEQALGVVFWLGGGASALKSHARGGGSPVARGHGHELHQIECNVFITAPSARACGRSFFHDSLSSSGKNGYVVLFFKIFVVEIFHNAQ